MDRGRTRRSTRHRAQAGSSAPAVRLSAAFALPEFRALWAAETLSVFGDQLARVALAVLVFGRTQSALLTGLTYALTFVPAFLGGALFGSVGDRYPRRTVMAVADLLRAVLMCGVALPGLPLGVLGALVAAVALLNGPFKSAQQALLPAVLPGPLYSSGMAVRSISTQVAQLAGFAGGGLLVSVLNPSLGLAIDAATFGASTILVVLGVRPRPPAVAIRVPFVTALVVGTRLIWRDPGLRALVGLCWLAAFYIVPEALAAPYAASIHSGPVAVGALMASDPLGSVVGGVIFGKWVPEARQQRVIGGLGVMAGLPLLVCAFTPPVAVAMLLFALSGAAATAYTIQATASFVRRLPDSQRAQGSGVLSSGLITVQGIGALVAGAVCDAAGPARTIALAGACGALVAVPIAVAWGRARRATVIAELGSSGVAVHGVHGDLLPEDHRNLPGRPVISP